MDFNKVYNRIKEIDLNLDKKNKLTETASVNLSLTGENASEVEQLMSMFKNAGVAPPPEMSKPPEMPDGPPKPSLSVTGIGAGELGAPIDVDAPNGMAKAMDRAADEHEAMMDNGVDERETDPAQDDSDRWESMQSCIEVVDKDWQKKKYSYDEAQSMAALVEKATGQDAVSVLHFLENEGRVEEKSEDVEEWDNSPDEDYQDNDYMQHDLAGGAGPKSKMYSPAANGDNPMSVGEELTKKLEDLSVMDNKRTESIRDQLYAALSEKIVKETKCNCNCGKSPCEKCGKTHHNVKEGAYKDGEKDKIEKKVKSGEFKKGKTKKAVGSSGKKPGQNHSGHLTKDGQGKVRKFGETKKPNLENTRDTKGPDKKTKEAFSGTGKTSRPGDQLKGTHKAGKSSPTTGPEQKNVTKGKLVGDSKINNKKAMSESKEVNDIIALATHKVGNQRVASSTKSMMDLKKLAGL